MKKLTLKDMTESEQREVKTELDKARKSHGRPLTNAEQNKVKDEAVARITAAREKSPRQRAPNARPIASSPAEKPSIGPLRSVAAPIVKHRPQHAACIFIPSPFALLIADKSRL